VKIVQKRIHSIDIRDELSVLFMIKDLILQIKD